MSDTEEIAKAIQEASKLSGKAIEASEKAAGFFTKALKLPVEEVAGLITDKLRFIRWKRMVEMAEAVERILEEKGVTNTRTVPPKIALPIFENASLEEDADLQFLWNHLLANAMDPDFSDNIRYGFIEMIKEITAREAKLLDEFYNSLQQKNWVRPLHKLFDYCMAKTEIMKMLNVSNDEYAVAANNLMRLQLIAPAVVESRSFRFGDDPLTIYKGIEVITLTPLGALFVEACER